MHYLYSTQLLSDLTNDRLRDAEHHRLLVQAGVVRPHYRHNYNAILNWLGQRLTTSGQHLQARYGQRRELSFR